MRAAGVGFACAALLLVAGPARAQDVPTVFLHGFNSDGSGWQETADRLRERTAISPRIPDLPWQYSFDDQAQALWRRPEYAGLSSGVIAIGHSNGGVVARESFRWRPLGGIVTIGSPHRGVPLLTNFGAWATFGASTGPMVASVVNAFSRSGDWAWVFSYVVGALNWASDFSVWSVAYVGGALGLNAALPITAYLAPGNAYLNGLNSSSNLSREASGLHGRVGVVSTAHDFYFAGPARLLAPDQADEISIGLYGAAYGLMYWGNYILTSADPSDAQATSQALALLSLSGQLFSIDPIYCRLVSSTTFDVCAENDGLLPYTTQEYPGAPNLYIGGDNNGPAHRQERDASEDVLYDALVHFLGVPARQGPPPPVGADGGGTGSDGSGDGGSTDDGSGGDGWGGGGEVWDAVLERGQGLDPGDAVESQNEFYRLVYQHDGNLVLYDEAGVPLWASHTDGFDPGVAVMQGDGNFVIYDHASVPRWHTATNNHPGAHLVVQNDGNVVVYDGDGTPLWASGTAR